MKKILLIAYHYHPDLQVGAQRTIKYVKYLPENGWQPHVLTVDPRYYPQTDDSPLGFECPVFRTRKWPVPDDVYRGIKRRFALSNHRPAEYTRISPTTGSVEPEFKKEIPWFKKFLNSLSGTPDGHSGWLVPGVLAARKLIKKHRYDVIYSSGPPQTCHLIGLVAHRLTGVPWVADFRDPWLYPKERDSYVLDYSKNFDVRYEAKLARRASLVLTTTDEWRDHLKQLYSPILDDKCFTVINGFDEDDFDPSTARPADRQSSSKTFLYAGNLYSGRDPAEMLRAGGELLSEGFIKPGEIVFDFYGNSDIDMDRIDDIISQYGLHSMVRFKPPVPREAYLRLLRQADVLVLIQAASGKVHIPAKAFEYLGTGNSILTLTTKGATKNFMSRFDHVSIAELENRDDIKVAIKKLMSQLRDSSKISDKGQQLDAITKRSLTKEFARHLDRIAAR